MWPPRAAASRPSGVSLKSRRSPRLCPVADGPVSGRGVPPAVGSPCHCPTPVTEGTCTWCEGVLRKTSVWSPLEEGVVVTGGELQKFSSHLGKLFRLDELRRFEAPWPRARHAQQ